MAKIKNSLSKPRKLALCGFMGAGKSSVYNRLEESGQFEGFVFIDTDRALLEANPSYSNISEYVELVGWQKFREDEESCIKKITRSDKNIILSLGGGSLNERVLMHFRSNEVTLVWLKVEFEELMRRANSSINNRPLLSEKTAEEIHNLYLEREKLYTKADIIIENSSLEKTVSFLKKQLLGSC